MYIASTLCVTYTYIKSGDRLEVRTHYVVSFNHYRKGTNFQGFQISCFEILL